MSGPFSPMAPVRVILPILMVLHLGLALTYAWLTPYRAEGVLFTQRQAGVQKDIGAPDERQHVNYIARLNRGEGVPVFDPKDPNLYENYQSHQPPLFYVAASLWTRIVGAPDPTLPESKMRVRSLNAGIGAVGVAGVFFFALWSTRRPEAAAVAGALAALLPMNLALSGAVSNDPLLIAVCAWTLALIAKGIQDGWNWRLALLAGVLVGLGALTKTTAVALFPVLGLSFLSRRDGKFAIAVGPMAAAFGAALLLAGPWWLRNQSLYGDPFALGAFNQAFVGSPQASVFIEALGPVGYWTGINEIGLGVGWWTVRSLLGVFGYMDIFLPAPVYVAWVVLLSAIVALRLAADRVEPPTGSTTARALGALFAFLIVALFVRFNMTYFQAQARYLLPALAPLAVGMAWASTAGPFRGRWAAALALPALLLAANVYVLAILSGEFAKRTMVF
ncbi:MAG: DUF2142 domain-containing protein [Fimbriimonadaceae bacterium]